MQHKGAIRSVDLHTFSARMNGLVLIIHCFLCHRCSETRAGMAILILCSLQPCSGPQSKMPCSQFCYTERLGCCIPIPRQDVPKVKTPSQGWESLCLPPWSSSRALIPLRNTPHPLCLVSTAAEMKELVGPHAELPSMWIPSQQCH